MFGVCVQAAPGANATLTGLPSIPRFMWTHTRPKGPASERTCTNVLSRLKGGGNRRKRGDCTDEQGRECRTGCGGWTPRLGIHGRESPKGYPRKGFEGGPNFEGYPRKGLKGIHERFLKGNSRRGFGSGLNLPIRRPRIRARSLNTVCALSITNTQLVHLFDQFVPGVALQ